MHARDALARLAAVAPSAEPVFDAGDEDRILAGILDAPRRAASRRRPVTLALVGLAVIAAAATVATLELGRSRSAAPVMGRHHRQVALKGAEIEMAGYHFRTPAGFAASDTSCPGASSGDGPTTVTNGFGSAASAAGGCVEAFYEIPGSAGAPEPVPADATPVDVGAYQGYLATGASPDGSTLYVEMPAGSAPHPFLVLFAKGLTEDQLIAVAVSGLPASP
jgi:hypothetical protein